MCYSIPCSIHLRSCTNKHITQCYRIFCTLFSSLVGTYIYMHPTYVRITNTYYSYILGRSSHTGKRARYNLSPCFARPKQTYASFDAEDASGGRVAAAGWLAATRVKKWGMILRLARRRGVALGRQPAGRQVCKKEVIKPFGRPEDASVARSSASRPGAFERREVKRRSNYKKRTCRGVDEFKYAECEQRSVKYYQSAYVCRILERRETPKYIAHLYF